MSRGTAWGVKLFCCFRSATERKQRQEVFSSPSLPVLKIKPVPTVPTCARGSESYVCNNRRNCGGGEMSCRRPVQKQRAGDAAKARVPKRTFLDGTGWKLTLVSERQRTDIRLNAQTKINTNRHFSHRGGSLSPHTTGQRRGKQRRCGFRSSNSSLLPV